MSNHLPRTPRLVALSLLLPLTMALAQGDAGKASRFYEDALKRYERKDYSGAIIQLKNALQLDKSQLSVHMLLGRALLANSEVASAEFQFSEALRLGVNRAEVVVPLAQSLVTQGRHSQVLDDPRLQLAGLPRSVQFQLLLVRALAASDMGDLRGAAKAIEEARSINPDDPASWLAEVAQRIRARQFREAMVAADQAVKLAPDSAEAQYQKGQVLHITGQIKPALAAYEKALKLDAGHVDARLTRAGLLIDLDRTADAKAELAELKLIAPTDARAAYLRAQLADRDGKPAAAQAELKTITELLDPVPIEFIRYRPQVLMLNGLAHFDLGELEKAKPYLDYALRLQPNTPLTKVMAQVHLTESNYSRAIDLLEGYLKARPGDGQALLMLATAHMAQGRHAKATALLQEALAAKDAPEFRTALGLSLMRGGKAGSATTELEKAYKADSRQIYAGLALVTVYLRNGQVPRALQIAGSLAKAHPGNASIQLMQATAKLQARDFPGAKAGFDAALKLDDRLLEAKLGLARLDMANKAFDAADRRLRELQRDDGRNPDVLFELATLYELWGKNDEALKWLESAVEASGPRQTRANAALVAWQLRKGQPIAALEAAKVLLSKQPEDVPAMLSYATAQLANGDQAGARATLTNASRKAAYEAPTLEHIARMQLDAKDLAGAAYSLDKALTESPDYLPAMALMSTVELLQGEPGKAERRARQIIQTRPKASVGHGLLADVMINRGQAAAAVEPLRRAYELERNSGNLLRLFRTLASLPDGMRPATELAEGWIRANPRDTVVQKALADRQAGAGNFAAARRNYEAVVKARPGDIEAMNNLASVLIRLKEPGALAIAEKALALAPGDPGVMDTAGWANHIAGKRDRALQLLRDARLRDPANPEIRYHLAAVLAEAGRKTEAREELQPALKATGYESLADARRLNDTLK